MSDSIPIIDVQILDHPVEALPFVPYPQPSGGECVFLGRTRCETHPQHGDLKMLSYEAYQPLALQVLNDLASQAAEQYECLAVRIHHAIGEVPPGQASVLIQVITGHRAEAFDAGRFLIDQLKAKVPIWKQEVWADGTTWSEGTQVKPESEE